MDKVLLQIAMFVPQHFDFFTCASNVECGRIEIGREKPPAIDIDVTQNAAQCPVLLSSQGCQLARSAAPLPVVPCKGRLVWRYNDLASNSKCVSDGVLWVLIVV